MASNNAAMGVGLAEDKRQEIIRVLLAAEDYFQRTVSAVRAEKIARLKGANRESESEVAGLRTEPELEYQKAVAEISGGSGENQKRMEQDAESKINRVKQEAEKVRDGVASMLLRHVMAFRI